MIKKVTVSELQDWMSNSSDTLVIDVRNPDEREQAMIEGTRSIPLGELENHLEEILKHPGKVAFHCMRGGRSFKACELLIDEGINEVFNVEGGITAWKEAGLPIKEG